MPRSLTRPLSIAAVAVSLLLVTSCNKNKQEDTSYAGQHATAEQSFDDVQNISDQAASLPSGSAMGYKTTNGGCATVTHNGNTITVDFGQTDCVCRDGRKRRGKIIISYTGSYKNSGSVHTITFDNYYQNDNKVTGTKTVTNMGNNSSGQLYFEVRVEGAVTMNAGGTVTAHWSRTRTWVQGYDTPEMGDDVYEITGGGSLTTAKGRQINIVITKPLIVAYSCHWVEAGSIAFSVASGQTCTLNYGDSPACDGDATLTLANGTLKSIQLP